MRREGQLHAKKEASINLVERKNHKKQPQFLARIRSWTTIRVLVEMVVVASSEERRMASQFWQNGRG